MVASEPLSVFLKEPFEHAVERLRLALQREGFGVVCDLDIQAMLRARLGTAFYPYRLLGVCDPDVAYRTLEVDPALGISVLCVIALYDTGTGTEVRIQDPATILDERAPHELRVLVDRMRRRLDHLVVTLAHPEA